MHKTERWVLFPYLAMDYNAAEDWLNQQARAGWRVASFDLRGWTVYLLPADRPDIRYCVDLSGEKARNQESYLALCHEAGWGLVETVRSMNVFCTLPGADPAPIQTDPGLERDRFERELMRGAALDAFAVVVEADWLMLARGEYRSQLKPHAACQSVLAFTARYRVPFLFAGTRGAAEYMTWGFLRQYLESARKRWRAIAKAQGDDAA